MHIADDVEPKVNHLLNTMPHNMGHTLGIKFLSFKKNEVKATMPVDKNTIQPFGILHGGASVALAESVASIGAWLNVNEDSKTAVGVEINANHIRAVPQGDSVIATSRPVHRGKKTQVWETKIHTSDGQLACISRCTLAIVDK
ncbi:MAG TPA: hotdog fold thioesterase [Balneolaceae bacterium]|nr:hotdog fold thioesterase [Balneolaceae bacterium]